MKKILLLLFLLVFVACGKDSDTADKNDGVVMSYMKKNKKMYEDAIAKVKNAESVEELDAVDEWVEDKEDVYNEEWDRYQDNNPADFKVAREQIESGEGKYSDLFEEIKLLKKKYKGLWKKRYDELD